MRKSQQYQHRIDNLLCPRCGTPVTYKGDHCGDCRGVINWNRQMAKERRRRGAPARRKLQQERILAKLCSRCGEPNERHPLHTCQKCQDRTVAWQRKNRAKVNEVQKAWRDKQRGAREQLAVDAGKALPEDVEAKKERGAYMREYMKEYWRKNPDKYQQHLTKQRIAATLRREAARGRSQGK